MSAIAGARSNTAASFAEVAERYLTHNGRHNVSWHDTRRLIEHDALPAFGIRPIPTVTRADINDLIDTVAQRAPGTARNLFAALRPLFRWALERDLIAVNPFAGLKAPPAPRPRDRVLTLAELGALWQGATVIGYPFGSAWQLLVRPAAR